LKQKDRNSKIDSNRETQNKKDRNGECIYVNIK